jgi:hypothetical protein
VLLKILVENASDGDETAIEAALELIVLLKEKSNCPVYFASRSLDKAAYWTPKVCCCFCTHVKRFRFVLRRVCADLEPLRCG